MKDDINIIVNDLGGELNSIKVCGRECLHQSDSIWKSQPPLLFPTIGGSHENSILVDMKQYQQNHHGFARNVLFERILDITSLIRLFLHSNDETKKFYPYDFILSATYFVCGKILTVKHVVRNIDDKPIFFNIGYHPGFTLLDNTELYQYCLEFEKNESDKSIIVSPNSEKLFENNRIQLNKKLFENGAIVLNQLNSQSVKLIKGEEEVLNFKFSAPYLGIWTRPDTNNPFLCLEPWYGLPDKIYCGDISKRPNVICLDKGAIYEIGYQVEFYK